MAVLLAPGQNVVVPPPPPQNFVEYPKMMTHPGFAPGVADKEIKVLDENGNPTGRVAYRGGRSVRYPPVLVMTADQEAQHASEGYCNSVSCDPAAFARAVASAAPAVLDYKPIQYPKWCHGKQVLDANEENEWLEELGIDADGKPVIKAKGNEQLAIGTSEAPGEPALSAEANTLQVWPQAAILDIESEVDEIAALEAKLAALKAKKATEQEPVVTLNPEAVPEPLVMKEPTTEATELFATESAADRKKREKSEKIKAGLARSKASKQKAAREAAATA